MDTCNTIHIPRALITSPFLQQPGLTPGQKRYLYTAHEAYGKGHVRKLIQQYYLNVIRRAIRTGAQSPEWPSSDSAFLTSPQLTSCTPEQQLDSKPQKKHSGVRANRQKPQAASGKKTLVLPKIGHRKSLTARVPESNARKSKQTVKKRNNARRIQRKANTEWDDSLEEDSLLSVISSLDLSEEDFPDII